MGGGIIGSTTITVGTGIWIATELLQFTLLIWIVLKAHPAATYERISKLQEQVIGLASQISHLAVRISNQENETRISNESITELRHEAIGRFDRIHESLDNIKREMQHL